ncbi:MAG TPA: M48 family metalloprotease [Thermoanaerobaculia bacterium]|jgi:predicted Zn-dependent protease|nr:M48 family metalloprotease [Thermoanaerobaculia bacterium]
MVPRPVKAVVARALLLVLPLAAAGGGCATNPATGHKQLSFYGEEAELSMGRAADAEIVDSVGLYDDEELADYVRDVGERLAAASERPYLPWRFEVLDDPAVNAFALPGGYVYVTRGILAELGSEAELAAVLGHEIGHVTARHSLHRQSQQLLAVASVGVAAVVLDPDHAEEWTDLGVLGLGLVFLKYSRDDERQADDLGLRYLMRAGYDPREMPGVFEMLEQVGSASDAGGGHLPGWLSTHPDPGARRQRISTTVTAVQARGEMPPQPLVERDSYLQHLAGLVYGPDPRMGVMGDGEAVHAGLGFRIGAPRGWRVAGTPQGLTLRAPSGDATLAVEVSGEESADAARAKFFAAKGVSVVEGAPGESVDPDWTRFRAQRKDGDVAGTVGFATQDGRLFELLAMAPAGRWGEQRAELERALAAFAPVGDGAAVAANHLELVSVEQPLRLVDFADRWPSTVPLADLALLNRVPPDGILSGGLVKRVVAAPR